MVTATIAHQQLQGSSESWLMTCTVMNEVDEPEFSIEDVQYVVKFFEEQCHKVAINEFVCHKIAEMLELPVLEADLVQVSKRLADKINTTKSRKIKPGIHFGTVYLKESSDLNKKNLSPEVIKKISNKDKVPRMIVFDSFVNNENRCETNAMVAPVDGSKNEYHYRLMDHSHCFNGPNWTKETIKTIPTKLGGIPWIKDSIKSENDFTQYIKKLNTVKKKIQSIVDLMPDEWKENTEDLEAFVKTIEQRNENEILDLVKNIKGDCPNWN